MMRKRYVRILTAVLVAGCVASMGVGLNGKAFEKSFEKKDNLKKETKQVSSYKEGEVLVMSKSGKISSSTLSTQSIGDLKIEKTYTFGDETGKNGVSTFSVGDEYDVSLISSKTATTKQLVEQLKKVSGVIAVEPNYYRHATDIALEEEKDLLWAIDNSGQNGGVAGKDIHPEGADSFDAATDQSTPVVAVIDTGVDKDFGGYLWENKLGRRLKGDYGFNCISDREDYGYETDSPIDDNGHGTHCAGIIDSVANKDGKNVQIMALKFLDSEGFGADDAAIAAYDYIEKAISLGVNVVAVNNSWGSEEYSEILDRIVDDLGKKGAISVFASGNSGADNDNGEATSNMYSEYMLAVAASTESDDRADFSNYGHETVDLAAPGTDILSTVANACFNPTAYSKSKIDAVADGYYSFNGTEELEAASDYTAGVPYTDNEKVRLYYDEEQYMSNKADDLKDRSLGFEVKGAKAGENCRFAIPFENKGEITGISLMMKQITSLADADTTMLFYVVPASELAGTTLSEMNLPDTNCIGGTFVYGKENYWTHGDIQISDELKAEMVVDSSSPYLLVTSLSVENKGDYTILFDDVATTSKEITKESFGSLDYYNGTSMATPYVSGAIGLLSTKEEFKSDSEHAAEVALDRMTALKGCVRESEKWADITISGGVLDLSLLEKDDSGEDRKYTSKPVVYQVSLDEEGMVTLKGGNLKNCTASINENDVDCQIDEKGKTMTFEGGSYKNHIVTILVTNSKSKKTAQFVCYLAHGKDVETLACQSVDSKVINAVSDGETIVMATENGLSMYSTREEGSDDSDYEDDYDEDDYDDEEDEEDDPFPCTWINYPALSEFEHTTINSKKNYTISCMNGQIAISNRKLYALLDVEQNTSAGVNYSGEIYLAAYDLDLYKWTVLSQVGAENPLGDQIENQTIAAYNGDIYVMGGYDYDTKAMTSNVKVFEPATGEWKDGATLPEPAMGGKAVQTGGKLVYLMGDTTKLDSERDLMKPVIIDANYVFDGTEWTKSAQSINVFDYDKVTYQNDTTEYYHTATSLGISGKNVMISGAISEVYGDLFMYSPEKDSFDASDYYISEYANGAVQGTCMDGVWYGFDYDDNMDDDLYGEGSQSSATTVYIAKAENGFVHMPNNSKYIIFKSSQSVYAPGETVSAAVKSKNGFTVGALSIKDKDGHSATMKNGKIEMLATSNISVSNSTVWKHISSLSFSKTKMTVKLGKKSKAKVTLKAKVKTASSSYKYNKKLTWSSSNTKYATVDQKGNVTVKKAGKSKKVKITAKAQDGSGKKATCTITIK